MRPVWDTHEDLSQKKQGTEGRRRPGAIVGWLTDMLTGFLGSATLPEEQEQHHSAVTSAQAVTCIKAGHWLGSDQAIRLEPRGLHSQMNVGVRLAVGMGACYGARQNGAGPGSAPRKGLSGPPTGGKAALCVHMCPAALLRKHSHSPTPRGLTASSGSGHTQGSLHCGHRILEPTHGAL